MKITKDDVRFISKLAHLALSEEEILRYTGQLGRIVGYVEQLGTRSVEEFGEAALHENATPLRADEVRGGLSHGEALGNAPTQAEGCFLVPCVIEEGGRQAEQIERLPGGGAFEAVIGLEVHCQLKTASKIFCGCPTRFGAEPNSNVCPVCLGMPGVLPVVNEAAVRLAVKAAVALSCHVHRRSRFARKNYFYPDLPKGYQITQYREPFATGGSLLIDTAEGEKRIGITRIHLEEDAGKSLHGGGGTTALDFNRAGVPLIEIVSEPDLRSADEAVAYLKELHALVVALGICDGNMEEGNFRCDANVSIRPEGSATLGTRTELKNLNSFRFIHRALEYEIARQRSILLRGGTVVQETRLYDPDRNETFPMRSKEEAHDYRYFPEPDLLPLEITAASIEEITRTLPELPGTRRRRFIKAYRLSRDEGATLVAKRGMADFFEAAVALGAPPKAAANWLLGEIVKLLNRRGETLDAAPIEPSHLVELIALIDEGTISGKQAKRVLEELFSSGGSPGEIVEAEGMAQISDAATLTAVISEVIAAHPEPAAAYRAGNRKVFAFFVGQVMKATKGRANPKRVNELLTRHLAGSPTP